MRFYFFYISKWQDQEDVEVLEDREDAEVLEDHADVEALEDHADVVFIIKYVNPSNALTQNTKSL